MEKNKIIDQLPSHLMQFVIDQPYNEYTALDQAVWRYVMRQNYNHLSKVAHESYVEGLKKTGISIDSIASMYGMNRILKDIGWAAVAVDGFIPPSAFMEFQAYKVLVIAADIRTINHIEYTPAPDIIHEAAGHAPIIADPEYAAYLRLFGEIGSKAISSKKDYELYEAIRHLSIIKEDPNTPEDEIHKGEKIIATIQENMGEPSEMAQIRNLHWWTVEYGLIGTLEEYRLYGAGLLSSIGESDSCMKENVKKLPYTIEAANYAFDITKPQPQLFVTPSFKHLTIVLNEFADNMALRTGGTEGLKKAISSENVATAVYNSGLQVSGIFTEIIDGKDKQPAYLKTSGPTALAIENKELPGHGKQYHAHGFGSPVGKLANTNKALEDFTDKETYFFNSNGDMTNKIYENYAKYTYEYDDNNREIKKTEQVWKNGIWENSEQEITTYDPMLPYSGKLRQVWVNNNWENKHRTLDLPITVDNEGNKIYKYDYQNWLQGAWTDNLRFSQKMKGNSLDTTLYALTESWQNQKWDTLDYFKVEYNSQGLFTQLESIDALYGKDQALGTKTVYELDEKNNHLSTTVYGCDGHKCFDNPVAWEPSLFVQVGGQNDPQLDYWIDFTWDKLQNIWIKTDSITNAYDIEGEPLVMAYEAYQNNKIAWGEKYTFAYEKTSVGIQTLSSTPVAVYPNPNNGVFHVKYESEAGNPVEFIVKDVYGRIVQKIKTFTNTTLQKFDLSEESAGIYFLEINTERNRLVKRITKI